MSSELRWWVKVGSSVFWMLLVFAGSGCDSVKSVVDQRNAQSKSPAPVTQTPETTPPSQPAVPVAVSQTPQQIIQVFLAKSGQEIRDEDLQQLAALKEGLEAITTLDLARSAVSDAGLPALSAFPKLTSLNLSDTRVSNAGMASVAQVKSLRTLTLANLRGVGDDGIQSLTPLLDLESLTIATCPVTDAILPMLAEFQGLQVLSLSGNTDIYGKDFKKLTAKGAFRNLRELHVDGSKFGFYGMEQLNKLTKLEVLRASGCEVVGKALNLAGCDELKVLDLSRNTMVDDNLKGISRLKKLEELRLERMSLTDECLNSIKTMKQLKILDLEGTRVTPDAIKLLKEKFLKETEVWALGQKF